jgi:hypothetical protein
VSVSIAERSTDIGVRRHRLLVVDHSDGERPCHIESMTSASEAPNLAKLAAEHVAACLHTVSAGSPVQVDSSSKLWLILELFIPQILRRKHPEWAHESVDGFFFSSAVKTAERSAEFAGTCILISDQTVTPFDLTLSLSDAEGFRSFRIRLGEPGNGPPLGISGPVCTSPAARDVLLRLTASGQQRVVRDATALQKAGVFTAGPGRSHHEIGALRWSHT